MAEKQQAKFTVPACAVSEGKPGKKRKTVTVQEKAMNKKSLDKQRDKTRVNIGVAFQLWRELRELKGLKSDSLALFLQVNLFLYFGHTYFCVYFFMKHVSLAHVAV